MAAIKDIWTDPAEYAIADRMSSALVEILAADSDLDSWTDGRIHRMFEVDPGYHMSRVPDIQVAATSTSEEARTNQLVEQQIELALQVRWPLTFRAAGSTEPTEATAYFHILKVIEDRCLLDNTAISTPPLANRYNGALSTTYEILENPRNGKAVAVMVNRLTWVSERSVA